MANNPILGYVDWIQLNESAKPDAVYFTVDFGKHVDLADLLERATKITLEKYSDVFTPIDLGQNKLTIALNVDEELGSVLTQIGGLKPIGIDVRIPDFTYDKISDVIQSSFPLVSENRKQGTYTYLLDESKIDFTDLDIIDHLTRSHSFANLIRATARLQLSKKIDFQEAERFLADRENTENVFYEERPNTSNLVAEFKRALVALIYRQLFIELIKEVGSFKRVEIQLSDFSSQLDQRLHDFKQKIQDYYSNRNKEEAKAIVIEIFNFQTELAKMLGTADARRRLASKAIVQTYDLFQQLGFSGTDAAELVNQMKKSQ